MQRRPVFPLSAQRLQSGMTLVVVLLFMAALAVGGLFSARSALMGEQLARNQLDIQVARQAAEAALRDGEKDLLLGDTKPTAAPCARGALRPVIGGEGNIVDPTKFTSACLGGQCDVANHLNANYASATSASAGTAAAERWWPTAKGGQWNDSTGNKPARVASGAAGNNCTTFTGGVPLGTFTGAALMVGVRQQPEYLIELIPRSNKDIFRITARGFGLRSGAEVVVQSYFQVPKL